MTKTLATLIRLSEKKVEDKQKEIAELNTLIMKMEERKSYLTQAVEDEYKAATVASVSELYTAAGSFDLRAKAEIQDIDEALADAEKIMEEKRDAIRELYTEQKRYDILHSRKKEQAKKEHDKQLQANLDEMAVLRYGR